MGGGETGRLADDHRRKDTRASKAEHGRVVPTWNYAVIHAYGVPEFYDDPARLHAHVSALTDRHEGGRADPGP